MQTQRLTEHIKALEAMRRYPETLYYRGNKALLRRPMVSIVGTRRASHYTLHTVRMLAKALASRGVCVVSGGAMGVDAAAHTGAGAANTVAVLGCGADIRYPEVNRPLLEAIEREGLLLSPFEEGFRATHWSFVVRNEIVVALGEVLIVGQAEPQSGSMRSVEYALKMGKPIYVLPHRLGESEGTNRLLREGKAEAIYDIDAFASKFGVAVENTRPKDDLFYFCQRMPTLDEALAAFGETIYEAELEGRIVIRDGIVMPA